MVDVERFASGQNRLGFSYLHYVYYVLSSHKTIDIVLFCFNSTATEEMRQWIGSRRPELVFVSGPRRRSRRPQRSLAPFEENDLWAPPLQPTSNTPKSPWTSPDRLAMRSMTQPHIHNNPALWRIPLPHD